MPISPLGLRELVLLGSCRDQVLEILPIHTRSLNTEGRVGLAVIPASSAFEGRPGRKVSVGAGLVEPAQQPVAHLRHVDAVMVHLGSFVLQQELALLNRRPDQTYLKVSILTL